MVWKKKKKEEEKEEEEDEDEEDEIEALKKRIDELTKKKEDAVPDMPPQSDPGKQITIEEVLSNFETRLQNMEATFYRLKNI